MTHHPMNPSDKAMLVAWEATDADLNHDHTITRDSSVADIWRKSGMTVRPLYASPAPDPVRTALAEIASLGAVVASSQDTFEMRRLFEKVIENAGAALRAAPQSLGNPLGSGSREAIQEAFKNWTWTKDAPALGLMQVGDAARTAFEAGIKFAISLPEGEAPAVRGDLHDGERK